MPRAWFRAFGAKELFGLPVRYQTAECLELQLQTKAILGGVMLVLVTCELCRNLRIVISWFTL